MEHKTFRVGLIGTGFMGRVRAGVLGQIPEVTLAGLCGSSLERAAPLAEELGVKAYPDWRRLLEAELDGVVISTPNNLHAEQAIAALQTGKHVLCEYPLATGSVEKRLGIRSSRRLGPSGQAQIGYRPYSNAASRMAL